MNQGSPFGVIGVFLVLLGVGLILDADGWRGTFLPQVWEGIPGTREFLTELMRKAGLPAETRITRCKLQRYRVLKFRQAALH